MGICSEPASAKNRVDLNHSYFNIFNQVFLVAIVRYKHTELTSYREETSLYKY